MPVTIRDRKILEAYRSRHLNGLPPARLAQYLGPSVFYFAVLAAVGWSVLLPHTPALGWLLIGGSAGAVLRDIGNLYSTSQFWPLFERIIDWTKVDSMIADAEGEGYESPLVRP